MKANNKILLSPEELTRYRRQIGLPGLGEEGQTKLKKAKVAVAGAGGLGSPVCFYLAAAGIGTLKIIDEDRVELSNLNRQILHWTGDLGKSKTESAAAKIQAFNPQIRVETESARITKEKALTLFQGFDVIVDAVDNLETRYILNKTAIENNIPLIHGAVSGMEGRLMTILPGKTACLGCLYQGVTLNQIPPVIGATAGVIGSLQATEAIKYITGLGKLMTDELLIYDGLNLRFTTLKITRDPACLHCGQ